MNQIEELVNKLNKYRQDYYNGSSEIADEEFDFYERELKSLDPNNEYFNQVGAKIDSNLKEVEHKFPMLSMNKVQTMEDAYKWYNNFASKYCDYIWVDPKLDGISGTSKYDSNGKLEYVATRGDGLVGAIIPFGDKINGVPKHFRPNSELRGEFIISKKYKDKLNGPLRNICSGIMKRKNYTDDVKYLSFVIYDIRTDESDNFYFKDRGDKIHQIETELQNLNENFITVKIHKSNDIKEIYENYINKWRDEYEYETDGIILTVDGGRTLYDNINSQYKIKAFNRYNIAVKPPAQFAGSEILDIIPFVNRRKVSFVAKIKPVYLLDTLINNATLDNYANIQKHHVGIGTKVLVKRSNDVIPKVYNFFNEPDKNIKQYTIEKCPCCGNKLSPIYQDLMCTNEFGCRDIYKSKLQNVIKTFDVKNIGDSIIDAICDYFKEIDNNHFTLFNFFKRIILNGNTYELEDFIIKHYNGGKRPEIFRNAINDLLSKLTETKILSCFNIPYIGETSLVEHGIRSLDNLIQYINELDKKTTFDNAFDTTLYYWWEIGYVPTTGAKTNSIEVRKDVFDTINLLKPYFKVEEHKGNGILYCISGAVPENYKNKQDFVDTVKNINGEYEYVKDVTSATKYLVTNERHTSKVIKANKYGVKILSFDEFLELIK